MGPYILCKILSFQAYVSWSQKHLLYVAEIRWDEQLILLCLFAVQADIFVAWSETEAPQCEASFVNKDAPTE